MAKIVPFKGVTPLAKGIAIVREFQRIHEMRKIDVDQAERDFEALLARLRDERQQLDVPAAAVT